MCVCMYLYMYIFIYVYMYVLMIQASVPVLKIAKLVCNQYVTRVHGD